jgi:hypothetical protein
MTFLACGVREQAGRCLKLKTLVVSLVVVSSVGVIGGCSGPGISSATDLSPSATSSSAAVSQTLGAPVTASFSGLVYDRATQTYNSVLTLTNVGTAPLPSPLTLEIATGTSSVTVAGSPDGTTYIAYVAGGLLLPKQTVTMAVGFSDPAHIAFTPALVTVTASTSRLLVTSIGSSVPVPAAAQVKVAYSSGTTVAIGGALPSVVDGSIPLMFAGDGVNDPLLLAVGSTTGTLDTSTTAIGMVRAALGLLYSQEPLTTQVLESAIQSSANYPSLLLAVNTALEAGESPMDSQPVIQETWLVANDTIASLQTTGVVPGTSETLRRTKTATAQADTPVSVSPPLPFYLINSSATNRVGLTDISGTPDVTVSNQTFIAWQLSTAANGAAIDSEIAPPLMTTALQLVGYYGGSASSTSVKGAMPQFTLTLSQSGTTQAQNAISSALRYVLFVWSAGTGLYPNAARNQCIVSGLSQILNPQLPRLLAQQSGTAAIAYFLNIIPTDPGTFYRLFSSCGTLPSVTQLFGATLGRFWRALNLIRSGVSTIGTVAQTFEYWTYSQDFLVCKDSKGDITSCSVLFTQDLAAWEAAAGTYINTTTGYGITSTALGSGSVSYPHANGYVLTEAGFCDYNAEAIINSTSATTPALGNNGAPFSTVLFLKGLNAFGFIVAPNIGDDSMTVALSNGQTLTATVDYFNPAGDCGPAQFFGFVGNGITSVTITDSAGNDFIFGNFYSVASTP